MEKEETHIHEQGTSDKVWNSIETILGSLEQCEDEDALMDSLDSILLLVDKLKTVHNPVEDEKKINFIGRLSKYIDIENGPRAVKCCSIILRVTTFGYQILHICKILFKISKQEKNDKVFKDDSIIAPLVRLLNQEFSTDNYSVSWEILLFTIGTLKNISYDNFNQKLLIKHNTISLLSLLLSSALRELKIGNMEKVNKQAQLLVQIMATLRNLAMKTGTFKQFLEYNVIDNIHILMNALMSHSEFIHNSTRVLSKLSLDETCTEEMRKISTLKSCLINVMKEHKKHKPIVVRVTFILGNITFQDYSDQELFDEKTEIPFLLDLLDLYSIEDERNTSAENVKKETEDLLTKLIRLIANISMDEHQGRIVAQSKQVTRLIEIIERKKVQDSEELILNTLRCITNLSFYAFSDTASPLYTFRVKLASLLSPLLFHDLTDVVYEGTRTFGNLSQDSSVREYITKSRIDEALIIMVEHGNTDIVYAVCGVLVNMTSDPRGIKAIQEHGAIEKLLDVLEKCNVSLALVILKIIHNICLNNEAFGENSKIYSDYDLEHLDMLLNDILNHEYDHEEMNEQEVSMLRDLSSVAQELQYILSK